MPTAEASTFPMAITWSSASRDTGLYPNSAEYEIDLPVELYNVRELKFGSLEATSIPLKREGVERSLQIDEGQQLLSGTCSKTGLNLNAFGVTATNGIETLHSVPCQNNPCTIEIAASTERSTVTITTLNGHGLLLASVAKLPVWLCCSRALCSAQELVNSAGLVSNVTILSDTQFSINNIPLMLNTTGLSEHNGIVHAAPTLAEDLSLMINSTQAGGAKINTIRGALRFELATNLRFPTSVGSIGEALGFGGGVCVPAAVIPFVSGMESMLRETVQRINGIYLTSAAVFGFTNSSGVTSAVMISAGTYSAQQLSATLMTSLQAAENAGVDVDVTISESEARKGFIVRISSSYSNTIDANDPKPVFCLHFSPFAQLGWAPTTTTASSQIGLAARLLGFTSGASYTSNCGVVISQEPSSYGSADELGQRTFRYQYNVMGDVVDRRVVVSARSVSSAIMQITPSSALTAGIDQSVLLGTPTGAPLAVHVGDVVSLSVSSGAGVTCDGVTTYKTSAQIVQQSGTGFILVTNSEHFNALCGGTSPTAEVPITVIASTLISPRMAIVPAGMGTALGFARLHSPSSVATADSAWKLEDPSETSILVSICPAGAVEGAIEEPNYVRTGPRSVCKCLARVTVRRSEEMLAMTASAMSEALASIARLKRVRVTFRNIDGTLCNWSSTDHLLTIVVRSEPSRTASRIPLMS